MLLKILDMPRWVTLFSRNWLNLFATVFFNFHYLPFRQAIKLPIWLYGMPHLIGLRGNVVIDAENISSGMVKLNATKHTPYPPIRFDWMNDGGTIVFHGCCSMDCGARIHVFGDGTLEVGDGVRMTSVTIGCQDHVALGKDVWVGNGTIIYDTDFHLFLNRENNTIAKPFKPVVIEEGVSIFTECYIAKGVKIPHHCVVAARTVLMAKPYRCKPYSLIGGEPAQIITEEFEHLRMPGEEEGKMCERFKKGEKVITCCR